jgi:peptidoglycan/LPS O-acetylase OafA/YrhL
MTEDKYRPDIDGLRAIAVLAVIAFHASPRLLPGGFVGVDIFFVISGFLISGILFREAAGAGVSLSDFYVRRIRRIVPALSPVLVAVAAFGWLALTNLDYRELQKQVAAGAAFVSNFVLWNESGYFDAPTRFKPLVHLWSLGIEEQFYLFWPPVVLLCSRRRWPLAPVTIGIVIVSFVLNLASVRSSPVTAFYMPCTRMWELLLGAMLALPRRLDVDERLSGRGGDAAACVGVFLLAGSFVVVTSGAAFPGWRALMPTVSAAAFIAAGPHAWLNRHVLSTRLLVGIGLISYPLYLWHWPLLSFLQIAEGGAPTNAQKAIAVVAAFALAAATYWLIERPIRRSLGARTPIKIAALGSSLIVVGGGMAYVRATNALTSRTPNLIVGFYSRIEEARRDPACAARFPAKGEYCTVYPSALPVTTALIGDSHAGHFLEGVGAYFSRKGENVVHLGQSGCPPLLDLQRISDNRLGEPDSTGVVDTCREADNSVIALVVGDQSIRRVIMSFNGARSLAGGDQQTTMLAGTLLPPDESMRLALQRTTALLLEAGKEVWLILQIPELEFHPAECVRRPFSISGTIRRPCAVPVARARARQDVYRHVVEAVKQDIPRLQLFDPWTFLCDGEWCQGIVDHELLYSDDNHLSREGSLFFADKFNF